MNKYYEEDLLDIAKCSKELKIENTTILVTGACGMIGRTLIKGLLKANNIRIIACDRSLEVYNQYFKDTQSVEYFDIQSSLEEFLKLNFNSIVHLASPTSSDYFINNPVETIDVIYSLTKKMLEIAKAKKSNMVYISSMEAFGSTDKDAPSKEEEIGYIPLNNVRSSYSEGKRIAELLCYSYSKEFNLNIKVARLAQTFGSGTDIDHDQRIFAYVARCIKNNDDIKLATNGESIGNYCYLSDTIRGILYILQKGEQGETYSVANEECSMTIKEMCKLVLKHYGNSNQKLLLNCDSTNKYPKTTKLIINTDKIKKIGFKPIYNLEEMFNRMIENA